MALWETIRMLSAACSRTMSINTGKARAVTASPLSPPTGANVYGSFSHAAASSGKACSTSLRVICSQRPCEISQPIARLHFQAVRLSQDLRGLYGPSERRSVNRFDIFPGKTGRQPPHLFAPFIRKLDIRRAGKAIFSCQHSRSMTNEKNSAMHIDLRSDAPGAASGLSGLSGPGH